MNYIIYIITLLFNNKITREGTSFEGIRPIFYRLRSIGIIIISILRHFSENPDKA